MVDVDVELSCHKIEYGFVPPKGYAEIKADPQQVIVSAHSYF